MYRIYEPDAVVIVMGAGRRLEEDVFVEAAQSDGVPLLRRRGGGGTVVLSPGQVVLALVCEVASAFQNLHYFRSVNNWFRLALADLGMGGIEDRGISDLAVGEKKILGTSIYRRRKILFYQGSLLVSNDLSRFDRYLRFPSRVPEYRRGRGHQEFCTSLKEQDCGLSVAEVMASLAKTVKVNIARLE